MADIQSENALFEEWNEEPSEKQDDGLFDTWDESEQDKELKSLQANTIMSNATGKVVGSAKAVNQNLDSYYILPDGTECIDVIRKVTEQDTGFIAALRAGIIRHVFKLRGSNGNKLQKEIENIIWYLTKALEFSQESNSAEDTSATLELEQDSLKIVEGILGKQMSGQLAFYIGLGILSVMKRGSFKNSRKYFKSALEHLYDDVVKEEKEEIF